MGTPQKFAAEETSSCKGRRGKRRFFWKDTSKTMLWKGTSALQKEEWSTVMQGDQRHSFTGIKGQGTTLLPFNKSLLKNQGPCLQRAVLSMLNERKGIFSWSLHSSERKERIVMKAVKTKMKRIRDMEAGLRRMGQLLQKTNSEQRWVGEKGGNNGDKEEPF